MAHAFVKKKRETIVHWQCFNSLFPAYVIKQYIGNQVRKWN